MRGDADLEEKFLYICNNPRGENLVGPTRNIRGFGRRSEAEVSRETPDAAGGTPTLPTEHASAGVPRGSSNVGSAPPLSGDRYYLKAMNCPHHHKLFGAVPRSYRDLPLRLAEYGTCYRYEQSGELFGLMRVRAMQMNDAHIYCTEEQFAAEFEAVNQMYLKYFKIFGIDRYQFRFSTHEPGRTREEVRR